MTFPAQSPDLRRFPLVAGASRSVVRSPRSAAPRIRFLFVDSRVRFTLRSAYASRRTPCASLRSLRPGSGRTFTSKSSPMPGPPQKRRARTLRSGPSPHLPSSPETRSDYKTLPLFDGEPCAYGSHGYRAVLCCAHSEGDNHTHRCSHLHRQQRGRQPHQPLPRRSKHDQRLGRSRVFTVALLPATDSINRSSLIDHHVVVVVRLDRQGLLRRSLRARTGSQCSYPPAPPLPRSRS